MTSFESEALARITGIFERSRQPEQAGAMRAYMREQFDFLGLKSPVRRALQAEALAGLSAPDEAALRTLARALWQMPEREYQYAACDILAKHVKVCDASFIETARWLLTTKSWWDTVDALAAHVAGPLVRKHPELAATMDEWIDSEDIWLARTAILHQLRFKEKTDTERLFGYALRRAPDREFFIRKAIGWALREYSKTDAAAVWAFVTEHDAELSPLTKREALLWLSGGRKSAPAG